ncbi:MAG TPA: HAD-IIIC family phosphatase [Allosphingosinicella sp.]|nr:HAD-IIIC family phosphatase [Allosphingosinicella sp.]
MNVHKELADAADQPEAVAGEAGMRESRRDVSVLFVGDVLTRPMARFGGGLPDIALRMEHGDIDQVHQVLAGGSQSDVVVLHTSADFFLGEAEPDEAMARMDAYCSAVTAFALRNPSIVIVNTLEHSPSRIVGQQYLEQLELLAALNGRVLELGRTVPNVSVVDLGGIVARIGTDRALSMQNALAMRMPYTKAALEALGGAYEQAIGERYVARKKVVVLDADNTLWGGIVGEDGVDAIEIDTQYPGSIYRRFQRQLVDLMQTGMLLALVSKNDLAEVREVFARRDMPLELDHFSSIQVNWEPKSDNIVRVAEELNVGLDSLIFIDDNPFELEQVASALPMVDTYRLDAHCADDALGLLGSIAGLRTWSLTGEDLAKTAQYRQQRRRSEMKLQSTSLEDYLRSLDIKLEIGINRLSQVKRVSQLTNKTNQFNLTTRRYSEADITRLMGSGSVFDVRLQDRFGDMGVIGVAIVLGDEIDTFLLSCRALGRGVEGQILGYVCEKMADRKLAASYVPTRKNLMAAEFYENNGFELVEEDPLSGKRYRLGRGPLPSNDIAISEVA